MVSREIIRMRLEDADIRILRLLRSLTLTRHHKHYWLEFCRIRQTGMLPTKPGQWSDLVFVVEWHTAIT